MAKYGVGRPVLPGERYYKLIEDERVILLTVKARYGQGFPRR
jgi:hypothetical protein